MEQGPTEKSIIDACIRDRQPLPNKIKNAPELELGLELFYNAFSDCSSCRHLGLGEGSIPWLAVDEYCDRIRVVDDEQREDVHYYVEQLDITYLKFRAKQSEPKKEPKR